MSSKDSNAILGYVQHYQRNIERAQDNPEKLLYIVSKLNKLPIKLEHLQETGIGKTVNALRKLDGEIGAASKSLVAKWKLLVVENNSNDEKQYNDKDIQVEYVQNQNANQDESLSREQYRSEHYQNSKESRESRNKNKNSRDKQVQHSLESCQRQQKNEQTKRHKESYEKEKLEKRKERHEKEGKLKSHKELSRENSEQIGTDRNHHKNNNATTSTSIKEEKHKSSHSNKKNNSESSKSHKSAETDHRDKSSSRKSQRNDLAKYRQKRTIKTENMVEGERKKIKLEPKADQDVEGIDIDSSTGANFADVLGMLNEPGSSQKLKKLTSSNSNNRNSERPISCGISAKFSNHKTTPIVKTPKLPALLASGNLEPLDPNIALELPTISNNYRPMPLNQTVMDCVFNTSSSMTGKTQGRTLTDAEALHHGISSKTMRTKIYSGTRTGTVHQVPSLFDMCIRLLQKNLDALEYTGGVPFEVLKNVLDRATPQQLYTFEEYNPYILEDSDILWKVHVQRKYRTAKRQEMESWREMFLRCHEDEDRRLNYLAETIKLKEKKDAEPIRKTQLAFVDTLVKPPRNIVRKQEQYGTRGKLIATPAARVSALSKVTPNAAKPGDMRLRNSAAFARDSAQISHVPLRPKKAPLMVKTLQLMRGRHKR